MFFISNISEFGPRGGPNFSIISEIQNILNYQRGGGGKPTWEFFKGLIEGMIKSKNSFSESCSGVQ